MREMNNFPCVRFGLTNGILPLLSMCCRSLRQARADKAESALAAAKRDADARAAALATDLAQAATAAALERQRAKEAEQIANEAQQWAAQVGARAKAELAEAKRVEAEAETRVAAAMRRGLVLKRAPAPILLSALTSQ